LEQGYRSDAPPKETTMSQDTPATESTAPLSVNQAASLFAQAREPQKATPAKEPEKEPTASPVEPVKEPEDTQAEVETEKVEDAPASDETVTIEVDGKPVEIKKAELADYYKNGLRQADYTRKTMEAAEQRKAAEAESNKAREERTKYAQGLQQAQAILQAQLQEQSQIDWQKLIETDPVEYLKQQHLANARQAKLQQIAQEQHQLHARFQAEQAQQMQAFLQTQQQELLAKLPDWKDESKAKQGQQAISNYLKEQGFTDQEVNSITDHRAVVMSHKAMLYDQMMAKAHAAAKKVSQLPQKVERPGGGADISPTDGRTSAMKRLEKSGSVRDAAAVFSLLRNKS
jgi:hypothetical protein